MQKKRWYESNELISSSHLMRQLDRGSGGHRIHYDGVKRATLAGCRICLAATILLLIPPVDIPHFNAVQASPAVIWVVFGEDAG